MSEMDVIKSYLVSLGFQIDQPGLDKWKRELAKIEQMAKDMPLPWLRAAATIASALGSITLATAGLLDSLAQADLGYKKFALRMYMTEDAAKRMKIATDALGESLDDIAWIPELRGRYSELMAQQGKMQPGGEFAAQMRHLRDIRFEFTRLRVEMTYGAQWIGSYLYKYLNKEIGDFDRWLKRINDYLTENMPQWTEKVAKFLQGIIQLGESGTRAIGDLWDVLKRLWESFSVGEKSLVAFGAAFVLFTEMGPFGQAVVMVLSLITALDDFYAYIDGCKSSKILAPIWYNLIEVSDTLKGSFKELWHSLLGIFDALFKNTAGLEDSLRGWSSLKDIFDQLGFGINLVVRSISLLATAVAGLINALSHPGSAGSILFEMWEKVSKGFEDMESETMIHEHDMGLSPEQRAKQRRRRLEKKGLVAPEGGGRSSSINPEANAIAREGMDFYMGKGLSVEQAAGIMGNAYVESAGLNPSALGDSNKSLGLFQMNGARRRGLEAYASSKGTSPTDHRTQLEYSWMELSGNNPYGPTETAALEAIKNSRTARESALAVSKYYERPGIPHNEKRIEYSESMLRGYQTYQSGSNAPYATTPAMFGGVPGKVDASTTVNGGIHIDARDTGGDPEKISARVIEKLEERNKLAEARALRESQPVFS